MPRPPDPDRRAQLLRAIVDHLERTGIDDLSLAPLAEAVGTSKRMLLYYFGDRGGLIAAAMEFSRPDVGQIFANVDTPERLAAASTDLWHALTRGAQRHRVRLLLQVLALSTTAPDTYGPYGRRAVEVVLDPITTAFRDAGFPADEAAVGATLVVSGLRGLCQDLLVTTERERVDAAAALLVHSAVFVDAAPAIDR
ncbi:TetR/AcrR family transcriptional regulator [Mycolicibacterium sediminis]|uniref:HTH tetR-type domain-containing protein n=1 Tax=Mycolicibacterium sediminis TaxID=1286180 RepID=A0A7I7QU36_9MYCO|nr:TetR family transcriptional regulator [Mycolicibacterium sediminis]BBY29530.1 hypothetical protein MSEDJ_36260 [Mycolicibacterium sediminis]